MQITLTPEQETRLAELAARDGRALDDIAREAIERYLVDDAKFASAVMKGLASLDRGEFVSHEDVRERIERLLSE
jgi:predicted transcriptional regulator